MMGERIDASSTPPVSSSIFSASSGGKSLASRSCESRPLLMPSLMLRSVSDGAPSRSRYWLSVMRCGLDYLNLGAQAQSLAWQNDFGDGDGYHRRMADPRHDWFLKEWLKADRKSTRLNSSHVEISYAVFCLKKKT